MFIFPENLTLSGGKKRFFTNEEGVFYFQLCLAPRDLLFESITSLDAEWICNNPGAESARVPEITDSEKNNFVRASTSFSAIKLLWRIGEASQANHGIIGCHNDQCFVLRGLESMSLPLAAPPSDVSCTSLQLASSVGSGSSAQTDSMAGKTSVQQVLEVLKKRGQQLDAG